MATSKVGKLEHFDLHKDDWELYIERFDIYCTANGITAPAEGAVDTRVPLLLSLVGGETYKRIRALVAPTAPSASTYDVLKAVLKDKTKPKPTQLAERYRFHNRVQKENEDVVTYDTVLREISLHCGFTDTNDRLRDQLVIGLRDVKIKSDLLSKTTVSYDDALKTAIAMETADREANSMLKDGVGGSDSTSSGIFKVNASKGKQKFNRDNRSKCVHCGRKNHPSNSCSFKDAVCHECSVKGHIRPICPDRGGGASNQNKLIKEIHAILNQDYDVADNYDTPDSGGFS